MCDFLLWGKGRAVEVGHLEGRVDSGEGRGKGEKERERESRDPKRYSDIKLEIRNKRERGNKEL